MSLIGIQVSLIGQGILLLEYCGAIILGITLGFIVRYPDLSLV
jgi:hypothetical protein